MAWHELRLIVAPERLNFFLITAAILESFLGGTFTLGAA